MQVLDTEPRPKVPRWRRVPPAAWVVLTLLVLLHGPLGACRAVLHQAWAMIAALLGGDQVVAAVLSQTAPLALAAALVVFLHRSEWITFEGMWSVLACAAILIGGASLGAELRGFCQRVLPGQTTAAADPPPYTDITLLRLNMLTDPATNRLPASEAWRAVTNWRYVSALGVDQQWPDRVPRVALLPEGTTIIGIVGRGVNQLLGYLVFYRPRMFLAALLAGGYLGWAWHRRLEWANERVIDWTNERQRRRAA